MGFHLGAIGYPTQESLEALVERVAAVGRQLGESADGTLRIIAHDDASGARTTITLERDVIACLTPTFRPGGILSVRIGSLAAGDCPFERPLLVEVYEFGHGIGPEAIGAERQVLDLHRERVTDLALVVDLDQERALEWAVAGCQRADPDAEDPARSECGHQAADDIPLERDRRSGT